MGIEVGNKGRQSPKFRLFEPRRYKRVEAKSASSHVFDSQSSRRKISLPVKSDGETCMYSIHPAQIRM